MSYGRSSQDQPVHSNALLFGVVKTFYRLIELQNRRPSRVN
jgi:hypothetical protein